MRRIIYIVNRRSEIEGFIAHVAHLPILLASTTAA